MNANRMNGSNEDGDRETNGKGMWRALGAFDSSSVDEWTRVA